ncbi:MAG: nickel/cobalt exporter [Myxococcota bacterium]|jgi:nickel/cobalt exporter
MTPDLSLHMAAVSVALIHTVIGVDHYLPFVVLGRARDWSLARVAAVTAVCGVGHVVGSIVLGLVGIGLGSAIGSLEWVESVRGELAAWSLIAFGLAYAAWGVARLRRETVHSHAHVHVDGTRHDHSHDHHREHAHPHLAGPAVSSLFVIFVLGPCEPLIPVLMAPAFQRDWSLVLEVAGLFAVTTIVTMVAAAVVASAGVRLAPVSGLERYGHIGAGGVIASSGLAIQLLGI